MTTDIHGLAAREPSNTRAEFEFFQHLSVLDTGAALIAATLVEKISEQPVAPWLLACSVFMFAASLAVAGLACLKRPHLGMMSAALFGFLGGVACLASFLYLNWLGQQ